MISPSFIKRKRAKTPATYPQLVFIGRHNISGIEGVAPSATDDAKKVIVVAWREVDDFWGNALDTHNVEGERRQKNLERKGLVSTFEWARTGGVDIPSERVYRDLSDYISNVRTP